jgi:putative oxidoreductase
MDWKQLVRSVLMGGTLEPYAILLVRILLGLFFAISGGYKLLVSSRTETMYQTLVEAGVPFPRFTTYFVSSVEVVGGLLLIVGFLTSLASAALLVDMVVATLTATLSTLPKGLAPLDWLDNFLYLPEVLYIVLFVWLICSGPGRFSVDYVLAAKWLE